MTERHPLFRQRPTDQFPVLNLPGNLRSRLQLEFVAQSFRNRDLSLY